MSSNVSAIDTVQPVHSLEVATHHTFAVSFMIVSVHNISTSWKDVHDPVEFLRTHWEIPMESPGWPLFEFRTFVLKGTHPDGSRARLQEFASYTPKPSPWQSEVLRQRVTEDVTRRLKSIPPRSKNWLAEQIDLELALWSQAPIIAPLALQLVEEMGGHSAGAQTRVLRRIVELCSRYAGHQSKGDSDSDNVQTVFREGFIHLTIILSNVLKLHQSHVPRAETLLFHVDEEEPGAFGFPVPNVAESQIAAIMEADSRITVVDLQKPFEKKRGAGTNYKGNFDLVVLVGGRYGNVEVKNRLEAFLDKNDTRIPYAKRQLTQQTRASKDQNAQPITVLRKFPKGSTWEDKQKLRRAYNLLENTYKQEGIWPELYTVDWNWRFQQWEFQELFREKKPKKIRKQTSFLP